MGALNDLEDARGLFPQLAGTAWVILFLSQQTHIGQMVAFSAPVADLPRDVQCLLIIFDRAGHMPQVTVGIPEIPQSIALSTPVASLS